MIPQLPCKGYSGKLKYYAYAIWYFLLLNYKLQKLLALSRCKQITH